MGASVIDAYYRSLQARDEEWKALWAETGVFADASRTLHAVGRPAVIESFTPFLTGVAGLEVASRIVDGDRACYVIDYTYRNREGATLQQAVAEVWRTDGDRLAELVIYFDLTEYRRFIRGSAAPDQNGLSS